MSETKSTAAALRTAGLILDVCPSGLWEFESDQAEKEIARIIDRKMGSPKVEELLMAANSTIGFMRVALKTTGGAFLQDSFKATITYLERATREVEAALKGEGKE